MNQKEAEKPYYQNVVSIKILNELNNESGKFGWCTVCRRGADNYCKDTRVNNKI